MNEAIVVAAPAPVAQAPAPVVPAPVVETAEPIALQLTPSTPTRVQIPALGVTSSVIDLGLERDGSMEVPGGAYPVGWFDGSPTPGELGPSVLAGHVDWSGEPGAFYGLRELLPHIHGPWLLAGDFNLIRCAEEKNTSASSSPHIAAFNQVIHDLCISELPFLDCSFTWSNMRAVPTLARLDCMFINNA